MKKIKPNELKFWLGKRVNTKQLEDILDTYIILTDAKLVKNDFCNSSMEGVIDVFSTESIRLTKENSVLIFYDSFERDEDCYYE